MRPMEENGTSGPHELFSLGGWGSLPHMQPLNFLKLWFNMSLGLTMSRSMTDLYTCFDTSAAGVLQLPCPQTCHRHGRPSLSGHPQATAFAGIAAVLTHWLGGVPMSWHSLFSLQAASNGLWHRRLLPAGLPGQCYAYIPQILLFKTLLK